MLVFSKQDMSKILPLSFYQQEDVLAISRQLLGKYLFTNFDGHITGGMIMETEAYRAPEDRASHAYGMLKTKRNEVMYEAGGVCYMYLCYGIHSLFNIVTNQHGIPHAILVRAIHPTVGIDKMLERRQKSTLDKTIASGPGTLTQALGLSLKHNGMSLMGPEIWIEDKDVIVEDSSILASPRIGIDYAGADALLPWRFNLKTI